MKDARPLRAPADAPGSVPNAVEGETDGTARRLWLRCLAYAHPDRLETAWNALHEPPAYALLRPPETGLAMIRARMGGTGRPFNLGEMTVTRCVVRLAGGQVGVGFVAGRGQRHATLVALFDALLQDESRHAALSESLITPLAAEQQGHRAKAAAKTARTKVDFFTMVRGE
ncbi:MAG: phosphonate C-P lyase system protein PhnG [Alphaproteobacteria bacterium]|jgi:alpha-D-ribose 1-methylphosphonate 5-triphosphate synthase subunit PhnG|nr:phosphonate C-P lyase system protein PhnG [Alphaproteobacteria bacterium]